MQPAKENDCLHRFRHQAKYLLYFDPDEFLELAPELSNITAFLRILEERPDYSDVVAVQWSEPVSIILNISSSPSSLTSGALKASVVLLRELQSLLSLSKRHPIGFDYTAVGVFVPGQILALTVRPCRILPKESVVEFEKHFLGKDEMK